MSAAIFSAAKPHPFKAKRLPPGLNYNANGKTPVSGGRTAIRRISGIFICRLRLLATCNRNDCFRGIALAARGALAGDKGFAAGLQTSDSERLHAFRVRSPDDHNGSRHRYGFKTTWTYCAAQNQNVCRGLNCRGTSRVVSSNLDVLIASATKWRFIPLATH
jgi:hypothetical protein